jgi:hypothetical protein
MWINLKILKNYINFFLVREKNISLLFYNKKKVIWTIDKKIYFNRIYSRKFVRKVKDLLLDFKKYYLLREKEDNLISYLSRFYEQHWFLVLHIILLPTSFRYIIKKKYTILQEQDFLLRRQYAIYLRKYFLYDSEEYYDFIEISLISKYFLLLNKLLLYLNLYILYSKFKYICYFNLQRFIKIKFLLDFNIKKKKEFFEESNFMMEGSSVFFKAESRWIKNKEILLRENLKFIDILSLDYLFYIWRKYYDFFDNDFFLFFKSLYQHSNCFFLYLNFLIYKKNLFKKKENLFLLSDIESKKILINNEENLINILKILPDYLNKKLIINIIYVQQDLYKNLLKPSVLYKGNILLLKKKILKLDILYLLFFVKLIKTQFFLKKYSIKKKYELKSLYLKKKLLTNFFLLFIIFLKLKLKLNLNFKKIINNFFFYFYYFFLQNKLKNFSVLNIDELKNIIFKKYNLINFNKLLFNNLLNLIFSNLDFNIEINNSRRYNLLNKVLFNYYKKHWIKINKNLILKIIKYEKLLLKNIFFAKFYNNNKYFLKKLYDIYLLSSLNFLSLNDYKILLLNKLINLKIIFKIFKKKLKKKNIYIIFKKKFLKKQFFKNYKNYFFSLKLKIITYLIIKLNKLTYLNFSLLLKMFFLLKNIFIKDLFLNFFLLYNKKNKKRHFFFKFTFDIVKAFLYNLSRSMLNIQYKKLNQLLYFFMFFILNLNLNFNSKILYFFKNIYQNFCLFFFKKLIFIFKKRSFGFFFWHIKVKNKKKMRIIYTRKNFGKNLIILKQLNFLKKKNNIQLILNNNLKYFIYKKELNFNKFIMLIKNLFIQDIIFFFNRFLFHIELIFDTMDEIFFLKNIEVSKKKLKKKKINLYYFLKFSKINYIKLNLYLKEKFIYFLKIINLNKYFIFQNWFNLLYYKYDNNTKFLLKDLHHKQIILFKDKIILFISLLNKIFEIYSFKFYRKLLNINIKWKNVNNLVFEKKWEYLTFDYYYKIFFSKIIWWKRKIKFPIKITHIFSKNLYMNNFLKNYYLNLNFIFNINCFIETNCLKCNCCIIDKNTVQLIKSYQNILNLEKKNIFIKKFTFKLCVNCNNFIILIDNKIVYYFFRYKQVLKYFFLNKNINEIYIVFQNSLRFYSKLLNSEIFNTGTTLIQLKTHNKVLNFMYFYINLYDKTCFKLWILNWKNNMEVNDYYATGFSAYHLQRIVKCHKKNEALWVPDFVNRQNTLNVIESRRLLLNKIWFKNSKVRRKITFKEKKRLKIKARDEFFAEFVKKTFWSEQNKNKKK